MGRCKQVSQSRPQPQPASSHIRSRPRCQPIREKPNIAAKIAPPISGTGSHMGMLLCESLRNKTLRGEIKQLRTTLEINKTRLRDISSNIQLKKENVNGLIETITNMESGSRAAEADNENDEDIDNLLKANLGNITMRDILSMTEATFPVDLVDLDFSDQDDQQEQQALLTTKKVEGITPDTCYDSMKGTQHMNSKEAKYIKEVQCISNKSLGKHDIKVSSKISTSFDEGIHSCPHCARTFPRGSQLVLNEHIQQCHSLYPFHCQDCRKKLPTMSIFAAHKRGHKLMHPFKCGKCGYKLGALTSFVKHVKSAHGVTSIVSARDMLLLSNDYEYV